MTEEVRALAVGEWSRPVDESDTLLLDRCVGRTLDVGCGPGRMARALADTGHHAVGIDVSFEAIQEAHERGARVWQQDVFEPMAGEGSWDTALLADGNIGIGGDPVRLLRRLRELLVPGGRVVTDLAPPGTGVVTDWLRLRTASRVSRPFLWATVAADELGRLAATAGLEVVESAESLDLRYAVLQST